MSSTFIVLYFLSLEAKRKCPTVRLQTESDRKQINRNKVWRLTSISR